MIARPKDDPQRDDLFNIISIFFVDAKCESTVPNLSDKTSKRAPALLVSLYTVLKTPEDFGYHIWVDGTNCLKEVLNGADILDNQVTSS